MIADGFGLLALVHYHAQVVAEEVVRHLHFNPASHVPRIFMEAAQVSDVRLKMLALAALAYAAVRFVEAYGLWRQQVWAEWFGILSGSIYLPVEVYELTVKVTPVRCSVFFVNLLIVGWLSWVRWRERK